MGQTGDLFLVWCLGRGRVPTLELRLNMLFTTRPPLLVFPHPAPPVLAGSALSGCDIHPDEEGAPPARGAGGASRRYLPAWASAPRPSRRTGTRGPEWVSAPPVPPQPRAAARRSPPPGGRRAARLPATTAATFPARPTPRFGLRSPPRPAPPRSALRVSPAVPPPPLPHPTRHSSAMFPARRGATRPGPPCRARRGPERSSTVQFGTVRCSTMPPAATRRSLPR